MADSPGSFLWNMYLVCLPRADGRKRASEFAPRDTTSPQYDRSKTSRHVFIRTLQKIGTDEKHKSRAVCVCVCDFERLSISRFSREHVDKSRDLIATHVDQSASANTPGERRPLRKLSCDNAAFHANAGGDGVAF